MDEITSLAFVSWVLGTKELKTLIKKDLKESHVQNFSLNIFIIFFLQFFDLMRVKSSSHRH